MEINKTLKKNFYTKGKNYKRSGLTLQQSVKASRVAFNKAVKFGINRTILEKEFQKGFESD